MSSLPPEALLDGHARSLNAGTREDFLSPGTSLARCPGGSAPDRRSRNPQDHGGNRREVLAHYGLEGVLDFSASINPLGQPEGLQEWVQSHWEDVLHYPDRGAEDFAKVVARSFGVPRPSVLVGNGSAELIDLVLRGLEPARVVLTPPDFGLYERLVPKGTPIARVPRSARQDYSIDAEALSRELRSGDLLIFSNPCNPSGCLSPREQIVGLLDRCGEVGATLGVDEAFADFSPAESLLRVAPRTKGLVVFRSMTKFYGIPGLRLGFLVAAPETAARANAIQVPWSVNALAQVAGIFCLGQEDWFGRSHQYLNRARAVLEDGLAALPGSRPLSSSANYLLVELTPPAPGAAELYEGLARRGILVRHCGSFGLGNRFVRLAVRTVEENRTLIRAMAELWAQRSPLVDALEPWDAGVPEG